MLNVIWQFVRDEEGASAAEYALLLTLITLLLVAALGTLDAAIQGAITTAAGVINPS
ncbi:MAG TPA: Flp family type IVb pilin [Anaerolineales bacterium]|jgi:Flp pilus assembly pilin Flp|nr:Flp family type IVb pilin [Anaerolineales bacterium]